jgi:hypothetical protein
MQSFEDLNKRFIKENAPFEIHSVLGFDLYYPSINGKSPIETKKVEFPGYFICDANFDNKSKSKECLVRKVEFPKIVWCY